MGFIDEVSMTAYHTKIKQYVSKQSGSAYNNITVDGVNVESALNKNDVTFIAGDNIQLIPSAVNRTITFKATDTKYDVATEEADGLMSSFDKAKLNAFSDASKYAKKEDISKVYKYIGSVATENDLPTTGVSEGDVYNIVAESSYGPAGANVAYKSDGTWDSLGGMFKVEAITTKWIEENLDWE